MITFIIATSIFILCALFLGLGHLFNSKNPLSCKRCGNPEKKEKECSVCRKKEDDQPS